ncbi:MAG: sulfite dehydrogenase [Spongiibacteraceae bacterium]|jgi:sulfane dehydrogenase subunit SoxC|nr:sulfite dehydrogenase [Spongiibacteraceae bacterium]
MDTPGEVAGNGLLERRTLMSGGIRWLAVLAAAGSTQAAGSPLAVPAWTLQPGTDMRGYGQPSPHESGIARSVVGRGGTGASRTPLESLDGTLTPNGLHFERHHNGVPAIDPAAHKLVIHGLVARPLIFSMEDLLRYPRVSRIHFLECSGNSAACFAPEPLPLTAGELHGLVSASEWTGIPLSILLDEAGVDQEARWLVAEGADAAALTRSVPLPIAQGEAMLALYQNGERLRPENGYPLRLFLPGIEGSANIKWLRRLEVTRLPGMARDETSKYTDLGPDGRSRMFSLAMGVKSVITTPSGKQQIPAPGYVQISGVAWSGAGRIQRVEVSADGGQSWADAELQSPVLARALTRFRMPWRWDGRPCVLQSRATDEQGNIQPSRQAFLASHGYRHVYHYNAIQSWAVAADGAVSNTYA